MGHPEEVKREKYFAQSLPYRALSLCCVTDTRGFFERHVHRAISEANRYHINRIELHDYYIPWVNYGITYRDFPKISKGPGMFQAWITPSDVDFDTAKPYMKEVFRKVKAAGLKLNLWYHVGRDVPAELSTAYPEYADVDSGFAYEFEEKCLDEFFELYPEVDGITVTSIAETDNILDRKGSTARQERLVRFYSAIHAACSRAGRDCIIRDFITSFKDYVDFLAVVDELPEDIIIMSKEVLGDWIFVNEAKSPFLQRYANRRFVVEFDLYGEYQGCSELPYANPEYYYKTIQELRPMGIEGGVGRIVHDREHPSEFDTIFDSFNVLNVAAFSRALYDSRPNIESQGEWTPELLSDPGLTLWAPWAKERFGDKAAPCVLPILQKLPDLIKRLMSACGFWVQPDRALIDPNIMSEQYRLWYDAIYPAGSIARWLQEEPAALSMLREDREALLLDIRNVMNRAARAAATSDNEGTRTLVRMVDNLHLTAQASRLMVLVYGVKTTSGGSNAEVKQLCQECVRLAEEIERQRGEAFYFGLPSTLRAWSEWGLK